MKTVLVGGCFDLIHFGHVSFLKQAREHGDKLIVMLESDETIKRLKGEGRPFHTQEQRKEMLQAIAMVDDIIMLPPLKSDAEYFDAVKRIHPDVIALTEGDPILKKKMKQTEELGAEAVMIPKISTPSTSTLAKLLKLE